MLALAAILAVTSACESAAAVAASLPGAKIDVSAFGVSLGVDTRKLTDPIVAAPGIVTDAVGLTSPIPTVTEIRVAQITLADPAATHAERAAAEVLLDRARGAGAAAVPAPPPDVGAPK